MAPLEPWERVWIDATAYKTDVHSLINCTDCHGGTALDDMNAAHVGMNPSPASDPQSCGVCHPDITPADAASLHTTLRGYDTVLYTRSTPENHAILEEMESNHCASCHTTCGDCHISQPASVGGGLLKGHTFVKTPPMSQTCTGCHGSRIKNEYFGLNEELPADAHFRTRMACSACHTADEVHGVGMTLNADHRYDGVQSPTCESCHQDKVGVGSGIEQHEVHGTEILSCQACHSIAYTNCSNCHVEKNENGLPFFKVEEHALGFYLGRNPLQNGERPYRFVPVRHVPIDLNSFSFYGENLLPNFNRLPTWVYSTPHNIQKITPQNQACENCHGNDDLFLTLDKVVLAEREANKGVIVDKAPPLPEGYVKKADSTPTAESDGGGGDGFWGDGGSEASPTPATGDDFWGGSGSSEPTPTPTVSGDDFWGGGNSQPTPTPTEAGDFWGGN